MKHARQSWPLLVAALVALMAVPVFARGGHESPSATKDSALDGFVGIEAASGVKVDVKQGAAFSVKASGPSDALDNLEMRVKGKTLRITYKRPNFGPGATVSVVMPTLESISLAGGSALSIDFDATKQPVVSFELSGGSRLEGVFLADKLTIESAGGSRVAIEGYGNDLVAKVNGGGKFDSIDWACDKAVIEASGGSTAILAVQTALVANASGGSRIEYRGNPKVVSDLSGGSRVAAVK